MGGGEELVVHAAPVHALILSLGLVEDEGGGRGRDAEVGARSQELLVRPFRRAGIHSGSGVVTARMERRVFNCFCILLL